MTRFSVVKYIAHGADGPINEGFKEASDEKAPGRGRGGMGEEMRGAIGVREFQLAKMIFVCFHIRAKRGRVFLKHMVWVGRIE